MTAFQYALQGMLGIFLSLSLLALADRSWSQSGDLASAVTNAHLQQINQLFRAEGIREGQVARDQRGRVELQGVYQDEQEVDHAFSLAQTVLGVRWVSPVTPERIKVTAWQECLSRLFSRKPCGPSAIASSPAPARPTNEASPGPVRERYALIIGIGKFKNGINPLAYASQDAYTFYRYVTDPQGGNFKPDHVILLRDQDATLAAIQQALASIRARATEDDMVVLYFSTHGTPNDKTGGVDIVTYDAEVKPRHRIWETSLSNAMLRDVIQGMKAKRLIVVLDVCYSNGAYSQIAGFLPPGGKSLGTGLDEGYGRSRQDMAQRLLGAKDLIIGTPSTSMPSSLPSRPNGWGTVLISASDAEERSWESDQLRQGIFTYFFLSGLQRFRGALKESFEYAKPLVRQQVKQEKDPDIDQTPQLTTNRNRQDWNMSLAATAR